MIGFMTLLDVRANIFAPSQTLPWTTKENGSLSSVQVRVVSYIFIALGLLSICVALGIYLKNMHRIVNRLLTVGHGWAGYSLAFVIVLFVLFVMAAALTTSSTT